MVVRTVWVLRKPRLRTPPLKESISRNNSMTFDELRSNFQNVRKQFKEADTLPPDPIGVPAPAPTRSGWQKNGEAGFGIAQF